MAATTAKAADAVGGTAETIPPTALDAVQATDGVPFATPANWVPGQDVIVALAVPTPEAEERFGKLDIKLPYLRFAKRPV